MHQLPMCREGALGMTLDCPSLLPMSTWDSHKDWAVPVGAPVEGGAGMLDSSWLCGRDSAALSIGDGESPDDALCLESRSLHLRWS